MNFSFCHLEATFFLQQDKPKFGDIVNKAVKAVEDAIEIAKIEVVDKEYRTTLEREDIGNTFQVRSI